MTSPSLYKKSALMKRRWALGSLSFRGNLKARGFAIVVHPREIHEHLFAGR